MSLVAVEDLFPGSGKAGTLHGLSLVGFVTSQAARAVVTARIGVSQSCEMVLLSKPPGEAVSGRKSLGVPCGTAGLGCEGAEGLFQKGSCGFGNPCLHLATRRVSWDQH